MNLKKLIHLFLFPHFAILIFLLPAASAALVYSMISLEETDPVRIVSYVLSFYTLLIWCLRIPKIIFFFSVFKKNNKYLNIWLNNPRLQMNVTLVGNVLWNGAYAVMQLGLGIYYNSAWFYSLSAYYFSLAFMRFFLVQHTFRHKPGEKLFQELKYYRICGWIFLLMNLSLSGMIFYMIYENPMMQHHEIITIAMAAYTFTSLSIAIVNVIRYRKYLSPAVSASKSISLAAACVSMLTLENTMLSTFGKADMTQNTQKIFLSLSGAAVSAFIIIMALYMILQSNKKLKSMEI